MNFSGFSGESTIFLFAPDKITALFRFVTYQVIGPNFLFQNWPVYENTPPIPKVLIAKRRSFRQTRSALSKFDLGYFSMSKGRTIIISSSVIWNFRMLK